jgi:hypothetical protein
VVVEVVPVPVTAVVKEVVVMVEGTAVVVHVARWIFRHV